MSAALARPLAGNRQVNAVIAQDTPKLHHVSQLGHIFEGERIGVIRLVSPDEQTDEKFDFKDSEKYDI